MFKKILMIVLGALSLSAQANTNNSPSNLQAKEITMQTIQLDTGVGKLAANLYLPQGVEKPAVVIVTGAWTTVKEQMPAVYAQALSKQGFATLTFDFRGWGQSDDAVRYLEDPKRKIEDIRAVIDAVATLEQVDGSRIAGIGICASSGYMLDAVSSSDKVSAVAVVAPWLHNKEMATAIYGGEESVARLLDAAEQAKSADDPVYLEAASTTNQDALMYQAPYYTETQRGLIPEYDNKFNVASWDGWLNYDAQVGASAQDKPVLMVASEAMALPAGAHMYLENAGDNVQAVWLDGVSQFDFYDQKNAVDSTVAEVTKFFAAHL